MSSRLHSGGVLAVVLLGLAIGHSCSERLTSGGGFEGGGGWRIEGRGVRESLPPAVSLSPKARVSTP